MMISNATLRPLLINFLPIFLVDSQHVYIIQITKIDMKPLAQHLEQTGMSIEQLIEKTGLDAKLVKAIVTGNYTASPGQRQRMAAALDLPIDEIAWGHTVAVEHLRGNGPQSGRST